VQAATSAAQLLGPRVSFGLRAVRVKILMLSGNGRPLALAPPGRDQVQLEPREAAAGRLRLLCPAFLRAFLREWSSALHVPCSTRMHSAICAT
jgi:hypothetical protein